MSNILCIGIATLDIINEVAEYPIEDDEVRILSQYKRRGGNTTNTAVILSQLGHQCYWAGTLLNHQAGDLDNQLILNDLDKHKINYTHCQFLEHGNIPVSYITLSQKSASRTIIHYRDLKEFSFQAFNKIDLSTFDWIHFEGRNIEQTKKMMLQCKTIFPKLMLSLEIEKSRDEIEDLMPLADIILFSKNYVLHQGFTTARDFFIHNKQRFHNKIIFCAWGKAGAAAYFQNNYRWQDAPRINAIDSIAAGDVFNAAIIDQQIKQQSISNSLSYACKLAADSCTKQGIVF